MTEEQHPAEVDADAVPLRVKELAPALGVSMSYVYQMRACGFKMEGGSRDNQTASLAAARRWIAETRFRVVKGRGQLKMQN